MPISRFRILYIAGQHPKQSKKNTYLFCILYFGAFICVALAGDLIKYSSPDGKFAMRLAGDVSEIVDVKSGKTVLELEEVSGSWAKDSKLLWSPDSKYFAHFSADRRGGSTTVYRQKGDAGFDQVPLPDFPDCEKTNVGKQFEASLEPRRWLNATTLVVLAREAWSNEDDPDKTSECERTITISFDASGKASIKNIKKGKK
ncbi:MAG: hypothetical protein DMF33_11620 [Verrucomicrobia bacterium]|nr:MAG: hypothetical protein DMF33_11620 [Verrucomicrobiota bacterium]